MSSSFNIDKKSLNVAAFLRGSGSGIKTFEGVMAERRVDAFKGAHATKALLSAQFQKAKGCLSVKTKEDAQKVLQDLMDAGIFVRAKPVNNTKFLQPDLSRSWSDDGFYVWVFEGSQLWNILGALLLVAVAVSLMMFPMWPARLRNWSWYLVMLGFVLLGLLFVISIVRLILFGVTMYTCPPGIWLFPNLWEDCSFVDSFIPAWDWHKVSKEPVALKKSE